MVRDNADFRKSLYLAQYLLYVVPLLLLEENKLSEMRFFSLFSSFPLPLPPSLFFPPPSYKFLGTRYVDGSIYFRTDNPFWLNNPSHYWWSYTLFIGLFIYSFVYSSVQLFSKHLQVSVCIKSSTKCSERNKVYLFYHWPMSLLLLM